MALPIPTLAVAETGGGYLWQLAISGAGMEMDRSRSTGAKITTLPDWSAFERRIGDLGDADPYRLVDETLASVFDGLQVPDNVVDKFSASLFDWVCDNRAALARLR